MNSNSILHRVKLKLQSSLLLKFILAIVSALVVMSTIMLLVQRIILNDDISEIQASKVERVGKLVAAASENAILSYDFELLERFSSEIRKDIDVVDVIFLDQSGTRLNSKIQEGSFTSSEEKFGKDNIMNSEQTEEEFPILSDGSSIGTLLIKTHSLETQSRINGLLLGVSLVFIAGVFFLIIIMWATTNRTVIKPLKDIESVATELATGNVEININENRTDEIGSLQAAFSLIIKSIKEQSVAVEQIAFGNLEVTIPIRSEKDVLSRCLSRVIESLKSLVNQVTFLSDSAVNGNLKVRGDSSKFEGGYKNIIDGVNSTLDAVILPIEEGSKALSRMAQNDFTVKVEGEYKGDHKIIVDSINEVAESLSRTLMEVSEAIQSTASTSAQISSSSEEMAAGAQEQSAQSAEVASSVEEMTATIIETTKNSNTAADSAKNAGETAKKGGEVVSQTVDGMNRISEVVSRAALTVKELGKSSDQIGEIVQVIDDIADQTNLLALNAAIEAARAGEQGRGFAVVADEVRKLAERTTKATKEIAAMIRTIQKDTGGAVESMEEGTEEVNRGKELANQAGESLQEIISASNSVLDVISQVATASEEQSVTAEQISRNIESINNVTQESATGVQQIARASEDLNRLTENLQHLISQFKIDTDSKSGSNTMTRENRQFVNS